MIIYKKPCVFSYLFFTNFANWQGNKKALRFYVTWHESRKQPLCKLHKTDSLEYKSRHKILTWQFDWAVWNWREFTENTNYFSTLSLNSCTLSICYWICFCLHHSSSQQLRFCFYEKVRDQEINSQIISEKVITHCFLQYYTTIMSLRKTQNCWDLKHSTIIHFMAYLKKLFT